MNGYIYLCLNDTLRTEVCKLLHIQQKTKINTFTRFSTHDSTSPIQIVNSKWILFASYSNESEKWWLRKVPVIFRLTVDYDNDDNTRMMNRVKIMLHGVLYLLVSHNHLLPTTKSNIKSWTYIIKNSTYVFDISMHS